MIVVVHIHPIAFPFPMATAIQVVGGHYPIGIVVEHDTARPVIDAPGDKDFSHMPVPPIRIGASRPDAVVIVVPIPVVVAVPVLVPALVFSVVVAIVIVAPMLVPAFVLAVIVAVVAVLSGCPERQTPGHGHKQCPSYDFAHKSSLQRLHCPPVASPHGLVFVGEVLRRRWAPFSIVILIGPPFPRP